MSIARAVRAACAVAALLLAWPAAAATPGDDAVAALARDPQWLRLLHYGRGQGTRSQINSPEFFLSPQGRVDPAAELRATLAAHDEPWGTDTDAHPRCRFPARYWLIARHLPLPGYQAREPRCGKLERWALFDRLRSASLLLVSGYFGNPASSFGHALLRLNTAEPGGDNLLDVSINYGALIPDNELTVVYVLKGLFGGYQSGFSDKHFYTQDLVYSRTEFRDIWDYELNLAPEQLQLLVLHLWETIGRKFDYYFLTENCAYRLGELLELVTGKSLLDRSRVWWVPVEMFHRIVRLDAARAPGEPALVRSVTFVPSSQRVLYDRFARMNVAQRAAANRGIRGGTAAMQRETAALDERDRTPFVDTLLAYAQYRVTAEEPQVAPATRALKEAMLAERLALPPQFGAPPPPPPVESPADAPASMLTGLGVGRESAARRLVRAQWVAFGNDQAGVHGLDGELVVADLRVGLAPGARAFLDQLDAMRVRKLVAHGLDIEGEDDLSWQVRIGTERERRDGRHALTAGAAFGAGRALALGRTLKGYAMLDGVLRSGQVNGGLEPNAGLVLNAGRWRGWARLGWRWEPQPRQGHVRGEAVLRYRLGTHQLASLEHRRAPGLAQTIAALNLYW